MTAAVDDYTKAFDRWVDDIRDMDGDLVSVVLCGSMARGDVVPGKSDIMDAYLFLRGEVFNDRERFLGALEQMVTACERLSESGLPFHPFYYWDAGGPITAAIIETIKAERESKVISGKDIRPSLDSSAASRYAARWSFFEARRKGYRLMAYCQKPELTKAECDLIVNVLTQLNKYVPMMACRALNLWPTQHTAHHVLKQLLPDIDDSVLETIQTLRVQAENEISAAEIQKILRAAVCYVESLNEAIVTRLSEQGELGSQR
jgi:hypothetical protein